MVTHARDRLFIPMQIGAITIKHPVVVPPLSASALSGLAACGAFYGFEARGCTDYPTYEALESAQATVA